MPRRQHLVVYERHADDDWQAPGRSCNHRRGPVQHLQHLKRAVALHPRLEEGQRGQKPRSAKCVVNAQIYSAVSRPLASDEGGVMMGRRRERPLNGLSKMSNKSFACGWSTSASANLMPQVIGTERIMPEMPQMAPQNVSATTVVNGWRSKPACINWGSTMQPRVLCIKNGTTTAMTTSSTVLPGVR
mmetsp:Transcript_33490/g.93292  ORF Transcript_33490/g.93292 Transcript_33490/m.93292 type:complete len:187 (-) Transcript_33490:471-1031(-)